MMLCKTFTAVCQEIPATREVIYQQNDLTIHANILLFSKTKIFDTQHYYTFYHDNKIQALQGACSGYLLVGFYSAFYSDSNTLQTQGQYRQGLKSGVWKTWHPNGTILKSEHWKYGKLNGIFSEFDEKGNLTKTGSYLNGQPEGAFSIYVQGTLVEKIKYRHGIQQSIKAKQEKDTLPKKNG